MIKILLSIYLLLSSFVLFAQGLFENDPIWRDEFNRDNVPSSMYWSYIVGMRGQESEYYTNSSSNTFQNIVTFPIKTEVSENFVQNCTNFTADESLIKTVIQGILNGEFDGIYDSFDDSLLS